MQEQIKLAYIGANGDIDEWRRFGSELHGMQAFMEGGNLRLRIDDKAYRFDISPDGPPGCTHIGFEWETSEALGRAIERVRNAGYDIAEDPGLAFQRQVGRLAHFIAPGGVRFELCTQLAVNAQPFVSPTGARFLTGEYGLGHIGYYADDVDAVQTFFQDIMGMRHSDTFVSERFTMPFVRGTARHHLVAIVPSMFRSSQESASSVLHHVYIEVDSITLVGQCWDKIQDGAAPVLATLGQHINDPVISYYCVSPSSFGFEYGWQSLVIDDDNWTPLIWRGRNELWGHKLGHMLVDK
ncbi:VOC family protein [Sphingobium sp.]|uniref:VOC family protein n=1 Tax=Sphingobium sp. TaxID=1912891 RepID=UPI0028BD9372|nr:VOC family protein [Sphingobium sp.]